MADAHRTRGTISYSDRPSGWRNAPVAQLQVLIAFALFLGGGGVAYGLRNLAIQLFALAILALRTDAVVAFARHAPRPLVALVVVTLALPLVQLIPMPPALWQSLPGRELVAESFAIADLGADRWFSASVDPMRTLVAFCGTLAPAAIIVVGSMLRREDKLAIIRFALICVGLAFALGAVQFASGNTAGLLYSERSDPGVFYATFANRNSTALMFVIALTILAALPRPVRPPALIATAIAAVFFTVAVFLTQSRTGMALLAVPLGVLLLRGVSAMLERRGARRRPGVFAGIAIASAVLASGALGASYVTGGRVADSVERFASVPATDRPEMWEDSLYAAGQYWPVGSGMGTFDEVFQVHESLEYVSPRTAGRAHSDWLEIAIEGGAISLLIALGWLAWCLLAALPRGSREGTWLRLGAGAAIGAVALQSLLDYPLRNQSMLCLAALCVVLLVRPRERRA